ncbi:MAG: hypothetical protein A2Z04_08555 [Chloroflexi bacterium RBG_16_57_9]|nr:MAG: hypothetical protein A2Z04_08555 [Chloroflexi bacterium RBG_16_57_9]
MRVLKIEDVGARWGSSSTAAPTGLTAAPTGVGTVDGAAVELLPHQPLQRGNPIRVTYHDACHAYRGLGIHEEPRRLLRHVRGLELVEMDHPDWCCGFGGSFSVRLPDISGAMLDEKIRRIKATGVNTVVTTDAGCIMHLAGGLKKRGEAMQVLHLARVLAHE